ncbi:Hachiman antiphage defense system protein HamA [Dyadobacter jiangsuensis]
MAIYNTWFEEKIERAGNKVLRTLTEKPTGRDDASNNFIETMKSHYDDLSSIADDIRILGFTDAAKLFSERLPLTKKARSGEFAEILGTEFVEEKLDFVIPVRRLRYKDGREMALRGDDFIGVKKSSNGEISLLKGESKSRKALSKSTIISARKALNNNNGRCTPASLFFIADRLLQQSVPFSELGRAIKNEVVLKSFPPARIHHLIFTVSANVPLAELKADLLLSDSSRPQNVVNIQLDDHQDCIAQSFKKVAEFGNN